MLRIGICDDIYDARLVLRAALERVLEKRRVQGQFREFSSGEGLLRWLESHAGELDLVFLDMEMGELDGMETARRLRAADAGLQLVFVTGYAEHVFDGYSVGALGYLLKPPKAEQLEEVLDRAQAALVRDLDRAYICRSGDTHYRIPIANILYFVSDRRQVACVTAGREYTFYGKLDTVAAEVGADFVRIHQRYLVRTGAVDRMEGGGGAAGRPAAAGQPVLPALGPAGLYPGGAGGMRMRDVLWQIWLNCGYFLTVAASGFFLYKLCAPFVRPRNGRFWRVLLFLTLAGSTGMVIWIGDPNLLYTLPAFFALFLLSTRGDRIGRVAVCIILFCLEMSVCALLDTYVERINRNALYDVLVRLARPLVFGPLWLLLRRRLPREPVVLSRRLWKLVLGLAAMPLCALIAVVLLTFRRYDSIEVNTVAMYQGMVVLPFVFLTSLVLLFAILILADHERLEQANRLAGLREVYYQGLRQQETQVRRLRHDLRNHLTAVRGFLEQGDEQGAIGYLDQIAGSPALRGTRRLCENEAANAVLTAKAEAMEREGVAADFAVSLPRDLPVADMDLCALLGNALDNAIEGSRGAGERRITIRCKADKGLFMLRVENTLGGAVQPDLATTKTDKAAHGFGIPGMREIAERYGGTLDAGVRDNGFELVVCLPLAGQAETL